MKKSDEVVSRARARKLKVISWAKEHFPAGRSEESETDEAAKAAKLEEMNSRYSVVSVAGKTRVASFEQNSNFPGSRSLVFSTIPDFVSFHSRERIEIRTAGGGTRTVALGRWWVNHPQRRQFSRIGYAPNENADDMLNLWTGFACHPVAGDCSLFLDHVRDVLCAGTADYYTYMVGWMARAVQHPGRPGEVAIVLRGKEGTGKGLFGTTFGGLYGSHFLHILHAKHLVGNFNAHLAHCSLLFADEALFAGDRSHESVLKGLITEPRLLIEPKGLDSFMVNNCVHLIIASNDSWVVPAGADARRFFVLDVADHHMQDTAYFAALAHQMENGGRVALLHYLLNYDISSFNVRAVPQTLALVDQKARSRRGIDRLVEIIANDGVLPQAHETYPDVVITTGEANNKGFYAAARNLSGDLKHWSSTVIARVLKGDWGCEHWRSHGRNGIRFPPLTHLRALFEGKHGRQDWQSDATVWLGDTDKPDDDGEANS